MSPQGHRLPSFSLLMILHLALRLITSPLNRTSCLLFAVLFSIYLRARSERETNRNTSATDERERRVYSLQRKREERREKKRTNGRTLSLRPNSLSSLRANSLSIDGRRHAKVSRARPPEACPSLVQSVRLGKPRRPCLSRDLNILGETFGKF